MGALTVPLIILAFAVFLAAYGLILRRRNRRGTLDAEFERPVTTRPQVAKSEEEEKIKPKRTA
jgi:hypothetical protein